MSRALLFVATLLIVVGGIGAAFSRPIQTKTVTQTRTVHAAQTIYVRNRSTFVTDAQLKNDIPAFQAATTKDFAPVWNVDANLVYLTRNEAVPKHGIVITLLDRSDIQGALAYHMVLDGHPQSRVFVGTSRYYGYSWTVGLTHELWEQLADPELERTMQAPDGRIWANEIADPVEADNLGYTRPGANGKPVLISDFITPRWFGGDADGPYDFMDHVRAPLAILKGGYAQWWDGFSWNLISNFRGRARYIDIDSRRK